MRVLSPLVDGRNGLGRHAAGKYAEVGGALRRVEHTAVIHELLERAVGKRNDPAHRARDVDRGALGKENDRRHPDEARAIAHRKARRTEPPDGALDERPFETKRHRHRNHISGLDAETLAERERDANGVAVGTPIGRHRPAATFGLQENAVAIVMLGAVKKESVDGVVAQSPARSSARVEIRVM